MNKIKLSLIIFIILLIFTGCKNSEQMDEELYYTSKDMDSFLEDFIQAQQKQNSSLLNENASLENVIIIPILVSESFQFFGVEVNKYSYRYYYVPMNYESDYFDNSLGIIVTMSREKDSFNIVMEQFDLLPENGVAYDELNNRLFLNMDNKAVMIIFPESLRIKNEDDLNEFFNFEEFDAFTK